MMRHRVLFVVERPTGFWVTSNEKIRGPNRGPEFVAGPYETLELAMDYIRQKK